MNERSRIGDTVRRLRDSRGWSQEELAQQSGLDLKTVGRVERGQTGGNPDTRHKLAAALGVPIEVLAAEPPTGSREPLPPATVLDEYRRNLIRSVTPRIEPNVELQTTEGGNLVDAILAPREGRPLYVWGPSGIGKSQAMLTAAKRGAEQGQVPVFARGILFRGAFDHWLTAATESVAAVDFAGLLLSAGNAKARLVVHIDAINEVAPSLVDAMLEGVQGLLWSKGASVVISGQQQTLGKWASVLEPQSVCVSAPNPDEFKKLAMVYGLDTRVAESVLGTLWTPMDVALAAEEWSREEPAKRNRYALLRSFVRRRLDDAPRGTHASLVAVAGIMKARIARTMRQSEFERLTESSEGYVLRSGLCQIEQGYALFRHDYFLDYFAAEHVLNRQSPEEVAQLLDTPIFSDLARLVVEAQSEPVTVLELFAASEQARGTLAAALAGHLGPDALAAGLTLVDRLRERTIADLRSHSDSKSLRERSWRLPEDWVADALGNASRSPVARAALGRLLADVEDVVAAKTKLDEGTPGSARWFNAIALPSSGHPVGRVLLGAHNVLQGFGSAVSRTEEERRRSVATKQPLTFALRGYLLRAESRSEPLDTGMSEELQRDIVDHVRQASASRFSTLFSDAMMLAHDCAGRLTGEWREEIVRVLKAVPTTGGLNDAWLLDALDVYGEVEPAYDAEALYQDMRQALALPFDPEAQMRACGLVAAATEALSAIHMPHIDALSRLSSTEVTRLRGMAAMGALADNWRNPDVVPSLACAPDCGKEGVAMLALQRWAAVVPDLQMMAHQAVLAFVYATEACARLSVEPLWNESAPTPPGVEVWKILGAMIHDQTLGKPLDGHWSLLRNLRFDALVPLLWVVAVDDWYDWYSSRGQSVRFRQVWRVPIAAFLREVLSEPAALEVTGLTPHPLHLPAAAALDVLSEVGDLSDVEWIRRFTTTGLGAVAVEAIKRLRERAASHPS